MRDASLTLKKLHERVLSKGGDLPLALLLELVVAPTRLREAARELGLSPKGGFRIDKAPAHVLAPLLAEQREAKALETVLSLLLPTVPRPSSDAAPAVAAAAEVVEAEPWVALREAELQRVREELERSREAANRGRDRETELAQRLQKREQDLAVARTERPHPVAAAPAESSRDHKDLLRRLHDLENMHEAFLAADQAVRRQLAHNQSRLRELEAEVQELEALLPKGKRRRKSQPEPQPIDDRRFRLPRFTAPFYKSLEGKERRAVERAVQAILLFCTEGHAYPGLEVKQLGGQDTWSLRASLGLRVYFRPLADGDIELLELGDREDQNTTLRRLKEK